ncbi:retrovirus-related pol polyprotein from transposon TNT 1-94 [Tanacetum coccineum]
MLIQIHPVEQLLPSNLIYLYVCPAVGFTCAYTMADMNIPANDVPTEQALAIAPPTRTDDQILPIGRWVPIGKSNYVLDVLKSQRNPIFKMAVAILKNTNFFRAFTASSTIPAIYIQNSSRTPCVMTQLLGFIAVRWMSNGSIFIKIFSEMYFKSHQSMMTIYLWLHPSSDAVIEYVNTLGYPCTLRNVSAMSVNDLYQPWRAILSMINMCLTGKTAGHDRPRHPVLQILWGIIHRSNIDYARIWEEFVKSIQTFLTDKKRPTNDFTFVGKDGKEVFGMPIPDSLLTDAIKKAQYYGGYLAHVAEYQQHLDGEHGMTEEGAVPESPAPKATKIKGLVGKRRKPKSPLKLVDEFADEGVPMSEPRIVDEEADYQRAVELSLKDLEAKTQGPTRTVVIREPDSGRFQPLPERRTPTTTEPSGNAKSPSLDVELAIADSEMEFDEVVTHGNKEKDASNRELTEINTGVQEEGQAGSNPSKQDEGQARSNPSNVVELQPQPSHAVHAGLNLKPMDLAENLKLPTEDQVIIEEPTGSTRNLSSLQNLEKELSFTDQLFVEKPQEEESEKTNAESEDAMEEIEIRWQNLLSIQENKQMVVKKRGLVANEDPNSKAFGSNRSTNEDIELEPRNLMLNQSNKADDTPVSLALMATNSEMEYDLKMRDLKLEEKQNELDQALKERDDFKGNPEEDLKDYAIIDSGCSGSMTGDKDKLFDFKAFQGGYVAFGNDPKGGRITGKGTTRHLA